MKYHIFLYTSLLALSFGLVSCSPDEDGGGGSNSAFDFNLRVFSPNENDSAQKLSSFGNSNLKLNDYVTLYNGEDLFPSWSLEDVRNYRLSGLATTSTHVTCYDEKKNKFIKESSLANSSFKLFEILPDQALLEEGPSVSCEFIIKGTHVSGASQTIVKMADIELDASRDFRIFPDTDAAKVYIDGFRFIEHLKKRNLLQTDQLDLLCKLADGAVSKLHLVSSKTQQLQTLTIAEQDLENKVACRMISVYQSNKYLSENIILVVQDVVAENSQFSPVTGDARNFSSDLFYTFRFTNKSNQMYELFVNEGLIDTITDVWMLEFVRFRMDEQISFSKPTLSYNHVQLIPFESVDVYVRVKQVYEGYLFKPADVYSGNKSNNMMADVTLHIAAGAFRIKGVSDSKYTTTIKVEPSEKLRERVNARRNAYPFNRSPMTTPLDYKSIYMYLNL